MKKYLSTILSLAIMFSLFVNCNVSANTNYCRVYDESGKEVYSSEVDTSDSRKSIQSCFKFIKNTDDDKQYTVKLDTATYHIGGSLDIHSNTTFDMNGSVIKRANANCPALVRFGAGSEVHYGYDGFKNVTVKNGTFDADRLNNVSMVRFAHAKNVVFQNVDFRNTVATNHMLTFAACDGVLIDNCGFYDMDTTGLSISANGEAVQIDVLIDGHFSYPAQDFTPTKNVKVTNCTFENLSRGLGTHTGVSGHYFENMEFSNNTFKNIEGYAIKAVNYRNSVIENNKIENCGSGIFVGNMTNKSYSNFYNKFKKTDKIIKKANIKIENNEINIVDSRYDNLAFGIQIYGKKIKASDGLGFTGDFRISGITIRKNTVKSSVCKKSCNLIWLQGVKSNSTKVYNNSTIYSQRKISDEIFCGIRIEDSSNIELKKNNTYDKSKIKPKLYYGIYVSDSSKIKLQSNKVKNIKFYGIRLYNTKNSNLIKNKVSNSKRYSTYLDYGCKNIKKK